MENVGTNEAGELTTMQQAMAEAPAIDTVATQRSLDIMESKQLRVDLDSVLQRIKNSSRKSRERSLTITKLQESIMWLGMDLKEIGSSNPYPDSYNPNNTVINPTADGLKM